MLKALEKPQYFGAQTSIQEFHLFGKWTKFMSAIQLCINAARKWLILLLFLFCAFYRHYFSLSHAERIFNKKQTSISFRKNSKWWNGRQRSRFLKFILISWFFFSALFSSIVSIARIFVRSSSHPSSEKLRRRRRKLNKSWCNERMFTTLFKDIFLMRKTKKTEKSERKKGNPYQA